MLKAALRIEITEKAYTHKNDYLVIDHKFASYLNVEGKNVIIVIIFLSVHFIFYNTQHFMVKRTHKNV